MRKRSPGSGFPDYAREREDAGRQGQTTGTTNAVMANAAARKLQPQTVTSLRRPLAHPVVVARASPPRTAAAKSAGL